MSTPCGEKRPLPEDRQQVVAVEVSGAGAHWLNQRYILENACVVRTRLGSLWPGWNVEHKAKEIYLGSEPSAKGPGSLPYIWYDWRHRQWKLATIGMAKSHYICRIRPSGTFPEDLMEWRPGPMSEEQDPQFPEGMRQDVGSIMIRVIQRGCAPTLGASPATAGADSVIKLSPALARRFLREGYVIMPAADVNTVSNAKLVLRAANIILRDALERGSKKGMEQLKDFVIPSSDPSWSVFENLLSSDSAVWQLLCQFTGCQLTRPIKCQLAIIFPEGRTLQVGYASFVDSRPHLNYHIDGRGTIPNGFTLLVGISLQDQPTDCRSWGGLTVFPGSHLRSDLHKAYPAQKRGESQERFDLGSGLQLCMKQGDVVIAHSLLAHRSSDNFSEQIRYMVYFRLKPLECKESWEDVLLNDPLANVAGAVVQAQIVGDELPIEVVQH